jgi:hypothetical protein
VGLARCVGKIPGVGLWAPIEANEIFLRAEAATLDRLERSE